MKCGKCKAFYPVSVHSWLPDKYHASSPGTQAERATDRPWFTAQPSPWLGVLPHASLLPSGLSRPGLFLLAPPGLCPVRRAVPCCPSQTRPTSGSDQQDTGIRSLLGPAGWKGFSGNSPICPTRPTWSLTMQWRWLPSPRGPAVDAG